MLAIISIMMPEIILAIEDWTKAGGAGVLIGTAALSFHVRPRMTQEIASMALNPHFTIRIESPKPWDRVEPVEFKTVITGLPGIAFDAQFRREDDPVLFERVFA
jgi:hypothetical protein